MTLPLSMSVGGMPTLNRTREGAKLGFTDGPITCVKTGLTLYGGHSAQGMLQAHAAAQSGLHSSITTVSKRGRPEAPGPAAAFIEAMAGETVHFMAKCDIEDPMQVECLQNWAPPPSVPEEALALPYNDSSPLGLVDDAIWNVRKKLDMWSPNTIRFVIGSIQDMLQKVNEQMVESRLELETTQNAAENRQYIAQLEQRGYDLRSLIDEMTRKAGA